MTYKDLPDNWSDLPIVGAQHTADILDVFVGMRDRMVGGMFLLLCDDERRPLQPIMIHNDPDGDGPRPAAMFASLSRMAQGMADADMAASVLIGIARDGGLRASVIDRAWADVFTRAFSGKLQILGIHLITPRGSIPLEDSSAQVA